MAVASLPLLIMLTVAPSVTAILLARFWMPSRAITLTQVVAPAGNCVVPRGENVELRARLSGRIPASAALQIQRGDTTESLALPPSGKPSSLAHTCSAVQEPFDYRFRAGDGQTPWYHVGIEDRPSIAGIVFRMTPPAYSKLAVDSRNNLPNRCRTLKGSRLEIALQASKPLASLVLDLGDKGAWPLAMTAGGWYGWIERLTSRSRLRFAWWTGTVWRISLRPPVASQCTRTNRRKCGLLRPAEEISLRPDEKIQVEFKARDDLGIAKAELVVSTEENGKEKVLSTTNIPLGSQAGAKNVEGKAPLDLKPFDLKQGQVLNYAVRVHDTRDAAAQSESGIRGDESALQAASAPEQTDRSSASRPAGLASTAPADVRSSSTQPASARQGDRQQNTSADPKESSSPKQSGDSQSQTSGQPKSAQSRREQPVAIRATGILRAEAAVSPGRQGSGRPADRVERARGTDDQTRAVDLAGWFLQCGRPAAAHRPK